jgi:hypothetical protein
MIPKKAAPHLMRGGYRLSEKIMLKKEAFMLNRITAVGFAVALAAILLVLALVSPALGPRASRADLGSPSLSIEDLHTKIDHRRLPVHVIPEP